MAARLSAFEGATLPPPPPVGQVSLSYFLVFLIFLSFLIDSPFQLHAAPPMGAPVPPSLAAPMQPLAAPLQPTPWCPPPAASAPSGIQVPCAL